MPLSYDATTVRAIHEALDDEYHARAAYAAIIERFGPVRPFVNIVMSEDRHAGALERLLRQAGEPLPADRWAGAITPPDTLEEALALGVQAEIDNRDMYDRLEAMTDRPEVLRVFGNLRQASENNHLTAFQRGLDRMTGGGQRGGSMSGSQAGLRESRRGSGLETGGGPSRGAGNGTPRGTGRDEGGKVGRSMSFPDDMIHTGPAGRPSGGRGMPGTPSGADRTMGFGGASGQQGHAPAGGSGGFGRGCGGPGWRARDGIDSTGPGQGYGRGRYGSI